MSAPQKNPPPGRPTPKGLLGLLPYLAKYKRGLTVGSLTLAIGALVGNFIPLVIGVITDCLAGTPQPLANLPAARRIIQAILPAYHPSDKHTLLAFSLAVVAIVAVKGVFSYWTRWVLIGVSRDIEYDLRNDLLARLLKMEPEFFVRNRTGELMSRATNDLNSVRMVLGPGIMYSGQTLVTLILGIVIMVKISPMLTLWVLLPIPILAVAVRYFGKVIHELFEKIQAMLATLSARAQENLTGVRVIRAYGQEEAEIKAFDGPNREYVARNMRMISTWSMFFPALTALLGATFLIVLWKGSALVLDRRITLGDFVAFQQFLGLLTFPMIALGWVTNIFERGAASMGRLNYVLHAEASINDAEARPLDGGEIRGEIEFRNLTFTYPTPRSIGTNGSNGHQEGPVLKDINLRIPAGSSLAIVGPTGSGKSTLAALVARLWEAPRGTVLLDGRSIREWPLEKLRRAIGLVPQDTFLFSETVSENIAFGIGKADREQIAEAAQIAGICAEIEDFPEKFETLVGERGITLSGGQKQRTALARAVVREPKILVLDDSLSSVDTDTEEKILRRLKDVMRERTTILISHRCSTVRNSNQIVVLRDGCIVERGTHDQLVEQGGYYADLYQKQLLEEELERA